jgi:hypothetical protein
LPSELIIKEGARVMLLTNKLFSEKFCNESIDIVTKYKSSSMSYKFWNRSSNSKKITSYFSLNGAVGTPAQ